MKLKRRFYDSSIDFKNVSLKRLVIGVIIGLVCAFTIYSFFYVLRESYRMISLGLLNYGFSSFQNGENILSEEDRHFYNMFFSGLSLILGNSIAILFIFSKPDKIINRLNPKRKRLLNDQVFLSFNFSYWFTKIGLVFGVFSMGFMDFDFLPYFKPLAYLLLIVLYLETWKNLALLIKKKRFKLQVLHLIIMLCLTFSLSKIDIVNYKFIDSVSLHNNPIIDFPHSEFYYENDYAWYNREIAFKLKLNDEGKLDVFTEDRNKIDLDIVVQNIMMEKASFREELIPFLSVLILADKDINVKYIKMFEAELYLAGIYKVHYEVYNKHLYETYFENGRIYKRLNKSVLEFKRNISLSKEIPIPSPPPPPLWEDKYYFNDTLKISVQKGIKINGLDISKGNLVKELKNHINPHIAIQYNFNLETKYQEYISVLSSHLTAVNELREKEETIFKEHRWDKWGNPNKAYKDEQDKLKKQFPVQLIEKFE